MPDPNRSRLRRPMTEEEYDARRRRRTEAGLDVPDTFEGFVDALQNLFAESGLRHARGGLEAARLWFYLRTNTPAEGAFSLDRALEAGFLLGLDAEAVGRALALLRRAELVAGTPEGFVTFNPAVPF